MVAFADAGTTTQGPRRVEDAGVEAVRAGNGLRITAYQGEQRSGGYAVRIERITRVGNELRVHARFIEPAPDSMNTMSLTYPSHTVSVDEVADVIVLLDATGTERARTAAR